MATRPWQVDDWVDVTLVGVSLLTGAAMIFVGAVVLLDATVLLLLFLVYQWLRHGVWYSYSLTDVLAWAGASDNLLQSVTWLGVRRIMAWFLEAPLLVVMPTVGGTMTIAGLVICFSMMFIIVRREQM